MTETEPHREMSQATDPEYAAISNEAVLGVVLAGVGVAGLAFPLLVIASLAGAVLSAVAVARIKRSEGVLTGRLLAIAGVAAGLLVTFGVSGYHGYHWLQERRVTEELSGQATEIGRLLVDGKYREALEKVPEEWRKDFSPAVLARRFEGAGELNQLDLNVLRSARDEHGRLVYVARLEADFEYRVLEIGVVFARKEGHWRPMAFAVDPTFKGFLRGEARKLEEGPPPLELPPEDMPPPVDEAPAE